MNEPLLHQPTFTKAAKTNQPPALKSKKTFSKEVTQEFTMLEPVSAPLPAVVEEEPA